ncbi:MAG TPA: glycerophosphodiester phosphodiesterase family protein [Pyrinomonadaceae bacterium]|nr:glycerophosphodiester phosphodiesterase family protein [Pyrinomonadaceae bacterium]
MSTRRADTSADSAPLIIGHRGASWAAPENTLAAFARALDDGADGLEFDVRLARDGVAVCIHDATLERTALCRARVSALTSRELSETSAGTWFNRKFPARALDAYERERIPTLAQVFELAGRRSKALYVEMKFEAREAFAPLAAEVVRQIRAHRLEDVCVVESFALEAVAEVKRLAPDLRAAALFERKLTRPSPSRRRIVEQALACRADEVALHHSLARAALVREARERGLRAVVWTADHPSWARRAVELSLRAVITNRPAEMRAALDAQLQRR